MNILYITNHLNIGGITSYVFTLASGLKRRGHNIYLASSAGELLSKFLEQGIIYVPIPIKTKSEVSPKILVSIFKLSGLLKQNNIDIIHSHSRTTQVLGHLLSMNTGIAHISTCHGFFKKRFFRKIFPCWGSKVIAISESVKEHLTIDFGLQENQIVVIHNGIDTNKFREQPALAKRSGPGRTENSPPWQSEAGQGEQRKKKLGLRGGLVVGIVARLSDVKGHIYLIEAMKVILEKMPDVQLLIVGDGKMKEELLRLSKRLGIERNVFFVPSVSDTREVLSAMDLFVMPSLKEGLGLALMEAMAYGLAVIGSDVGGITNLIKDNYNGVLVKPADSEAIADAILGLLQDPQKREALGKQAQIFINQNFSQEKMCLETEREYLKCLPR